MDYKEQLIKLLGLEANGSDEAISNAATTFQADMVSFREDMETKVSNSVVAVKSAEAAAKTATEATDKIANEAKLMAEELVNVDLERYKDVIVNADEVKAQLISNRASTVAILKNVKTAPKSAPAAPLHNAKTAGQPAPVTEPVINNVSEETAKKISNRASEMSKTLGISHQQAWIRASGEVAKETK